MHNCKGKLVKLFKTTKVISSCCLRMIILSMVALKPNFIIVIQSINIRVFILNRIEVMCIACESFIPLLRNCKGIGLGLERTREKIFLLFRQMKDFNWSKIKKLITSIFQPYLSFHLSYLVLVSFRFSDVIVPLYYNQKW